jgi:hypothetical protein
LPPLPTPAGKDPKQATPEEKQAAPEEKQALLNSTNDTAIEDAPTNAPEEKPLVACKKDTATKDATNAPTEAMERHERAVKIPLDEVKNHY